MIGEMRQSLESGQEALGLRYPFAMRSTIKVQHRKKQFSLNRRSQYRIRTPANAWV